MEDLIIYRGNDEQIILQLWGGVDVGGNKINPVNIDDLEDLQVRISIGGIILGEWNKDGSGDFTPLTRINEFQYYFWFQTNDSTKLGHADLWIETQDLSAALDDGINNSITAELNMFNVVKKPY